MYNKVVDVISLNCGLVYNQFDYLLFALFDFVAAMMSSLDLTNYFGKYNVIIGDSNNEQN